VPSSGNAAALSPFQHSRSACRPPPNPEARLGCESKPSRKFPYVSLAADTANQGAHLPPGIHPACGLPRLQPDPALPWRARPSHPGRSEPVAPQRTFLLPAADLGNLPVRAARHIRIRDRRLPRGRRLADARGPLLRRRRAAERGTIGSSDTGARAPGNPTRGAGGP
jgi:hypothetical protein